MLKNQQYIIVNSEINLYRNTYKNYIPYLIKTGNKYKIENMFREILFYGTNTISKKNQFKLETIMDVFKNTTPVVSVKTKRQGSRNIFLPKKITKNRRKYLGSN
jgi:hypothetical protein